MASLVSRLRSASSGKLDEATLRTIKPIKPSKDQQGGEAFAKKIAGLFDGQVTTNGNTHKVHLDYAKWKASDLFPNEKLRNAAADAGALVLSAHDEASDGNKLSVFITDANAFKTK